MIAHLNYALNSAASALSISCRVTNPQSRSCGSLHEFGYIESTSIVFDVDMKMVIPHVLCYPD